MSFDRKTIWVAVSLFAVLVLAVANWAAMREPSWPTGWYELAPHDSKDGGPSYSWMPEALFVDLPPLNLASLDGKVKLISSGKSTWEKCPIGYTIELDTLPIPKDKVPARYKKSKTVDLDTGPITIPPLDEATYAIHLEFHLLDADGFEIKAVNSAKHSVRSGQTSHIQSQTEPVVTFAQARRVETVEVNLVIDRNESAYISLHEKQ